MGQLLWKANMMTFNFQNYVTANNLSSPLEAISATAASYRN